MRTDILTQLECYQIAYVTCRGWQCVGEEMWEKEGFKKEITNKYNCGCCDYTAESTCFSLNDAYWAEKSYEEDKKKEQGK